jgi:hypothetical protein
MRKGITLLGAVLMAMALPLYADIFNPGRIVNNNVSTSLHLQIANSLITGTGCFSILDTSRQFPVPGSVTMPGGVDDFSNLTPVFSMSNPVVSVPEPMHYMLMGLGVVGLFLARRDRLNAK